MEVPVSRLRRKRIVVIGLLAALFVVSGVIAWRLIQSTAPDDSSAAAQPPVNACVANTKVLMYDLQYNNTAPGGRASESQTNLAAYMRSQGYNFTHGSRVTQPTITEAYLKQFDVVQFYNGCAGPVGMLTSPEILAIYNYYIAGGDLLLIADDANGDVDAGVGDCYSRVNQIAVPMGLQFTGNGIWSSNFPTSAMCVPSKHYFNVPFTQNVSTISQYSPTTFIIFGGNTWGGGTVATTLSTVQPNGETYYAAYSAPLNGRGSVTFMSEWAGFNTYNCHQDGALSYTQQWNLYLNSINNNANCPVCGNGRVETGEVCDDGNTANGDGCSSTCQREPVCGDGIIDPPEVCDDGNTVYNDGCTDQCQIGPICGNFQVDPGEDCDDGNRINDDQCSNECKVTITTVRPPVCVPKVLLYDLQPGSTAPNPSAATEASTAYAQFMTQNGWDFTHGSRTTQPTITLAYLQQFDVVQFYNGCGGPTGLPTDAEVAAVRQYYQAGGDVILVADDSFGDDQAGAGDCSSRVNRFANPTGVNFSGTGVINVINTNAAQCLPLTVSNGAPTFVSGASSYSNYSPGNVAVTGANTWGGANASIVGSASNSQGTTNLIAYSAALNATGTITYMAEWAGFPQLNCPTMWVVRTPETWNRYFTTITSHSCTTSTSVPSSSIPSSSLSSISSVSSLVSSSLTSTLPPTSSSVASSTPASSVASSSATTSIVSSVATSTPIAPVCLSLTQTSPVASVSYPPGTVFNYTAVFTCGGLDPNLVFKVVRADTGLDAGAVTVGSANYNSTNNQCTYNFTWTASGITTSGTYVVYLVGQGAPTPLVLSL